MMMLWTQEAGCFDCNIMVHPSRKQPVAKTGFLYTIQFNFICMVLFTVQDCHKAAS